MFWKKDDNKDIEKKLSLINENIKKSFGNVKKDTANIFQWLNYFYRKSMEQEHIIKQLQQDISSTPKTKEDIRRIINDYYSFDGMISRIRELNSRVDELVRIQTQDRHFQPTYYEMISKIREMDNKINDAATKQHEVHVHELPRSSEANISEIQRRLERLEQKKLSMKENIVKRLTRNSKEYVKSVILSYIRKYEKISALQLKEIVVDEQNFCSKSSFYRLLEEIEESEEVGAIKHGKEKHYLSKAIKRV